MPAAEESRIAPPAVKRLGIIAGGGVLPLHLLGACDRGGIETFVVGFEGQTDPEIVKGRDHIWTRLGAAGHVMKTLKAHEVRDLVLIGSIQRPSFSELVPDLKAVEFFARIGIKALGDNDFLSAIRGLLEEEGFAVHGVHKFATDLLAREGVMGKYKPSEGDWEDIRRGLEVVRGLGALDVGQAAIVQEGFVLGVEAVEGTDELLRRCKSLKRKGRKGVLVKVCKPQQDLDLDLPTIGPQTMVLAAECGLAGIVVHAGRSLVIGLEEVAQIANQNKMFLLGLDPEIPAA